MKRVVFGALGVFLSAVVLFDPQFAPADCGSYAAALKSGGLILADADGRIVAACNPDQPLVPASILKIATALIALQVLGPDHRFRTDLYLDGEQNLYLRGYGDPFLVTEELRLILERLREIGVTRFNSIFVDNASYALEEDAPGRGESDNPYDAPVGATAVNFNTVALRVKAKNTIVSAEAQTPTLPLMRDLAKGREPGTYRLNVCAGRCRPEEQSARHTAELIRALQRELGIAGDGAYGIRRVPAGAVHLFSHRNSRPLTEVLVAVLEHSNNFVANQVFLACGAARYGYPATWAKARRTGAEVLYDLLGSQTASGVQMVEGSGLSRANRVTARTMLRLLQLFAPHASLLRLQDGVRLKSGTLAGVHNYAGYLPGNRPFVILENQNANTRDRLLQKLMVAP